MMFVFGDVEHPLNESACIISKILKSQINNILKKASQVFPEDQSTITHQNLLYILKNNKERIWQLLHYLSVKDIRESYNKQYSDILKSKRTSSCAEYLNKVNKTKEFNNRYDASKDPLYLKRISKRFLRTENMNDKKYEEFSKKLQVSFLSRDKRKFEKWLLEDFPNLQLSQLAIEIVNFFAREIVAEIVECSVTIQDSLLKASTSKSSSNSEPQMSMEFGSDLLSNYNSKETFDPYEQREDDVKEGDSAQLPIYPRTIREVIHQLAFSDYILDRKNTESLVFIA